MPYLSLALLGPFQAWTENGTPQTLRTLKERALLAYLAVENNRLHRRDVLAELFWPDRTEGVARNNLRQALYGIRQAIGEPGYNAIFSVSSDDIEVSLGESIWLDLAAYDMHLRAARVHHHAPGDLCSSCIQHLQAGVELVRGAFMEGIFLENNRKFQDWVTFQRSRLEQQHIQALELLIHEYERLGDFSQAAVYAIDQISFDDLNEGHYYRLMNLLAQAGRGAAALDWYEACRRKFSDMRVSAPSEAISLFAEQIRQGQFEHHPAGIYAAPHNLPESLTPFFGREMELSQITARLESHSCRLISLAGLGGVGKTRLAIQAARLNMRLFPDGVYFVSLDAVNSAPQLLEVIGQVIGLAPGVGQDMRTVLLGYLRLKHVLLILDNFEHLLDEKGLLLEILQAAPFVKILLTSRERLRLQAEHLIELTGLSFPPAALAEDAQEEVRASLEGYAAVRLFLERAARVRQGAVEGSHTGVDEAELNAVVRICQLTSGLPLGIELAAGLARDYSFTEIAREAQRNLDFLGASFQDLPERQRSLRVSFEHSWDLLPESEREFFTRLSVFPASFSVAASEAVAGAAMPWLLRLEDRSLVRRVGYGRFDLHPLIRQYAGQKLRQFSRRIEEQTRQQHAEFYCTLLADRGRDLDSGRQVSALSEIEADLENIQAAWDWAVDRRALGLLGRAANGLFQFLDARTRFQEGQDWFRAAAEAGAAEAGAAEAGAGAALSPEKLRAFGYLTACYGWFCCRRSDFERAEKLLCESLQILPKEDTNQERIHVHFAIGFLYTWMGRFQEALLHLTTGRTLAESMGYAWGISWCAEALAEIAFESGQSGFSEEPFLQTLAQFEKMGDLRGSSRALNYLGNIALANGRYSEARAYFEKLLSMVEKVNDVWGAAGGYSKLGQIASIQKEYELAWRLHHSSLEMLQKMGDQRRSAFALRALGEAAFALGRTAEARENFGQALEIAARLRIAFIAQDSLTGMSAVLLQGEPPAQEQAAMLLGLVLAEPISDQLIANRAAQLLESVRAALPPAAFEAALQSAQSRTIWEVVDGLLRQGVNF